MTETAHALLTWGAARLSRAGVDEPRWEARHLLADAVGIAPAALFSDPEIDAAGADRFRAWIDRRAGGEPSGRIAGKKNFRGLDFELSPETLEPRGDSETLVDAVLADLSHGKALRIADLGTGTGCLLIALLTELPTAHGIGSDISDGALSVAARNAARIGVGDRASFRKSDWLRNFDDGSVDILVSNPPYIRRGDIPELDRAVRAFDPHQALDGGTDGLDAYRAIAADASRVLCPDGRVVLEIGWDQADAVANLLSDAGLHAIEVRKDLGGRDRVVLARTTLPTGL